MTQLGERLDLSEFDLGAPECDNDEHPQVGDGPPVWIIRFRDPSACGCVIDTNPALFCNACWVYLNSTGGIVHCDKCFFTTTIGREVISVEPL